MTEQGSWTTLHVALEGGVATVRLDRPDRANAIDLAMWRELGEAMRWLDATPGARVGVLAGSGKHFTAGIDLGFLETLRAEANGGCPGRLREALRRRILELQDAITAVERCRKPVIAAIHGACIGAGVDLVTACDLRYCTAGATFSVKEVDLAITADVGTLQRLPRLVGEGLARELAYTARPVSGEEAVAIGLANRCWPTEEALRAGVTEIARAIAAKSPLAVRGTKAAITYARDHGVADALEQVATWNAGMLLSADLDEAVRAARERRPPVFED